MSKHTSSFTENSILVPRIVNGISYNYILYYKIIHPNSFLSKIHPPLLVIHGGLGLPSDYLQPMASQIQEGRSVVFYDMLGCGRSESPPLLEYYSIPDAVHDLHLLLTHLKMSKFHLYAHSAGVVIAYEYLKLYNHSNLTLQQDSTTSSVPTDNNNNSGNSCTCLSAIFASGSFHMGLAKQCTDVVQQKIQHNLEEDSDDYKDESSSKTKTDHRHGKTFHAKSNNLAEKIRKSVICRTETMPLALKAAYEKSGTIWKGISVIQDYVATCPEDISCIPPILLLRGEFDFIEKDLVFAGWMNVLGECEKRIEMITLRNCSHMPMLEDPTLHGRMIRSFYNQHDTVT